MSHSECRERILELRESMNGRTLTTRLFNVNSFNLIDSLTAKPMNTEFAFPSALHSSRRGFLRHIGLGATLMAVPGAFAEELSRTPRLTEVPFYPDKLPL